MHKDDRQHYYRRITDKMTTLPWYVGEYLDNKRRKLSPTTLLNYCHDYLIFFGWLADAGHFEGSARDVPLELLEKLTMRDMDGFLDHLEIELGNNRLTVNHKLSSLKSLFDYLQNKAETRELTPYLRRNIMAKMELNAVREDQHTTASRIGGKILRGAGEFDEFRQFVSAGYGEQVAGQTRLFRFHELNRERDTALVSLILGSGLRLSEAAGADVRDLDLARGVIRVTRKGNKEQYVYFSDTARQDLARYLAVREERYGIDKKESALFVAAPVGTKARSRRLTGRAMQKLVDKYVRAFGRPSMTVHTLRHSFATRYHAENNDVPKLRFQLGHTSIQTTMIYTHLTDDELRRAVERMENRGVDFAT